MCEFAIAHNVLGRPETAIDWLSRASESDDGRIRRRAHLERTLLDTLADGAAVDAMLEAAQSGIAVFEGVGDDRSLGRAWLILGWGLGGALARYADWEDAATRALASYDRAGWPATTCIGHIATAVCLGPTPVDAGIARCTALRASSDLTADGAVSAFLAHLQAMSGDFDAARLELERSIDIYTELGRLRSLLVTSRVTEARVAQLAGDLEHAAAVYAETCDALLEAGEGFYISTQGAEYARVLCALGRFDEAAHWAETADGHARVADRAGRIAVLTARSLVAAQSGSAEAPALAEEAVALASETDAPDLRAGAYLALAETAVDPEAAFAAALDELERKGNVVAAASVRARFAAAT
jgi:tetratricopeptide (TPR) repeat protein